MGGKEMGGEAMGGEEMRRCEEEMGGDARRGDGREVGGGRSRAVLSPGVVGVAAVREHTCAAHVPLDRLPRGIGGYHGG
jgi:hypothetical protein